MKKNIIYISLLTLPLLTSVVSCNTDRFPETSVSDGNFWNSASDVRLAANYFYTTLPGLAETNDNWSADAYPNNNANNISDGSRVAPTSSSDYSYYGIFQANNLIEKAPKVIAKGADATVVNQYVGEARFFRAWYYFEMFKRFGGVPLITKTMQIDDPDVFKPRATRDEVLDLIYSDLDYAISVLRTPDQLNTAGEYGRISNTAALAFKARIALFEGTRSKYHGYGTPAKHLNIAKECAEKVMNSGQHALFSTPTVGTNGQQLNDAYYNLFQEKGDGRANKENIIVRIYGVDANNNVVSHLTQRIYEGSYIVPTNNFVSRYLMADGLPITKSPLYKTPDATMTHADFFKKRDPRMSFTLFKRGDEFIATSDYTTPNPTYQRSGYGIRKYANKNDWTYQRSFIDRPILRYAEVLLTYAEALYEINGTISDSDLDKTVNLLRARLPQINIGTDAAPNYVSMAKLNNAFVTANGLDMREEIRRERRIELAYEGFSYWDLIRWKTAETELPQTLYGSYLFTEYITTGGWDTSTIVDSNKYIILQPATSRKFDPKKDYLWPLPTVEIAKNPKIEQNPGW
ncbi:RagB/SusD family nutrient uptake outer membrane protein [Elizabethkingia sp. HX WHF]|uniref:RagB/SusD family nutrient uptake outer membrane protein n=1 Tax=Elizabethkingia TaxID=308865 RepID=UPI000999B45A|nr:MULTISPECIES: RagB/SusD family nutrient uptake outer membrane protein [Elizabethkingia]ATL45083.1 RagB/SusD family nutrient uptake outer membrane protein [Elizabethkingia miricola]MCL1636856.1 RagB/SusD family nutrient uptake outer membrane protein [Elizabethkingia bruuniana]MDX8564182.1 RagB/SusD family nutrient uptake outer membrane protein [Elizabethkingia sp. HX WHF]OPC18929.1 carbohydrate-binding protein SusD [Elizabethkingia bruuniana]